MVISEYVVLKNASKKISWYLFNDSGSIQL